MMSLWLNRSSRVLCAFGCRRYPAVVCITMALLCANGFAQQANTSSSSSGPKALQVTPSGRTSTGGNVQVQQSANGAASSSVDTVNSSIQVSGAYQGSISDPNKSQGTLALTIGDAIQRGLRFNLGTISANSSLRQLRGERLAALSEMLPNIYASLSETGTKLDLQTLGITTGVFGPQPVPTTIGPFHYYGALGNFDESVSLTSLHNLRQASASEKAGEMSANDARELIVLAVAGTYLQVLAAKANVVSEEAQVKQSATTYKQADDEYHAGTRPVIDRNRDFVEYHTEEQRLVSLQADLVKQTMRLARLIGLPVNQALTLSEELPARVPEVIPVDQGLNLALKDRYDLQAAGLQLTAAQEAYKASKAEYLPSIDVTGNYGVEGVNPNKGASVFQAAASIRIPIFNSGRTKADVEQADAALSQRQAEYIDQKGVVELDVRNAYVDLQVATQQIATAIENRRVAAETLTQSVDRFGAGVTDSVEVVQSEETVASAERDYVNSLFTLNLARVNLARATGQAEQFIPNMLKGN